MLGTDSLDSNSAQTSWNQWTPVSAVVFTETTLLPTFILQPAIFWWSFQQRSDVCLFFINLSCVWRSRGFGLVCVSFIVTAKTAIRIQTRWNLCHVLYGVTSSSTVQTHIHAYVAPLTHDCGRLLHNVHVVHVHVDPQRVLYRHVHVQMRRMYVNACRTWYYQFIRHTNVS